MFNIIKTQLYFFQICNFNSNIWIMTLDPCRTKWWHASFLWSCPLATETQHGSKKRTLAWETLLGEQPGAQNPARMECPKGRYVTPTTTGHSALPPHCRKGASCLVANRAYQYLPLEPHPSETAHGTASRCRKDNAVSLIAMLLNLITLQSWPTDPTVCYDFAPLVRLMSDWRWKWSVIYVR